MILQFACISVTTPLPNHLARPHFTIADQDFNLEVAPAHVHMHIALIRWCDIAQFASFLKRRNGARGGGGVSLSFAPGRRGDGWRVEMYCICKLGPPVIYWSFWVLCGADCHVPFVEGYDPGELTPGIPGIGALELQSTSSAKPGRLWRISPESFALFEFKGTRGLRGNGRVRGTSEGAKRN